jgi:ubiquinone/menaquinone biosynthesis C-methylase UbiE
VAWTFIRPADPSVLDGRPLLDLGTGDGQTLDALAARDGLTVGVDRTFHLLGPGAVNAEARELPFRGGSFATVLAADLFHHLDDAELLAALTEIGRVMAPQGRLVAWWYEETSDRSPDAPRYPRTRDAFTALARTSGFSVETLEVIATVADSPTVGVVATA